VALALRFPKTAEHRYRAIALLLSTLIAMLVALNAPGFHWVNKLPGFRAMWYRYNVVFSLFSLCFLAGIGVAQWFSSPPNARETAHLRKIVLTGLIILLGVSWFIFTKSEGAPSEFVFYGQILFASLTAFLALVLLHYPRNVSSSAILIVLLLEFFYAFHGYHPTVPREHVYVETQLTHRLLVRPGSRFTRAGFFQAS